MIEYRAKYFPTDNWERLEAYMDWRKTDFQYYSIRINKNRQFHVWSEEFQKLYDEIKTWDIIAY